MFYRMDGYEKNRGNLVDWRKFSSHTIEIKSVGGEVLRAIFSYQTGDGCRV